MKNEINFTIENKLVIEKRDMNIYHNATRSAHMISFNSSVTLPLQPATEDDYLYISIVNGPGHQLRESIVNLPTWVDFELLSEGKLTVTHSAHRTLLKIPPGLPSWQLKLTRSSSSSYQSSDHVTIAESQQAAGSACTV
jgi:hypothetical protein